MNFKFSKYRLFIFLAMLCLLIPSFQAFAEEIDYAALKAEEAMKEDKNVAANSRAKTLSDKKMNNNAGFVSVQSIDLGTKKLTLDPGETYTFRVKFTPKNPSRTTLFWTTTNDSVVTVDPANNQVTAHSGGSAVIMAESFDKMAYAICVVEVNGPQAKDGLAMKSGSSIVTASKEDRAKISAPNFNRHLSFVENADFNNSSFEKEKNKTFYVTASVKPGTEEKVSKKALAFGLGKADPLPYLNAVNLKGTIEQILGFIKNNNDIIEIFEVPNQYLDDPVVPESESVEKNAMRLKSNVQSITKVNAVHKLGLYGQGTTIAVIDTGLNSRHEQFKGRVIYEHCFGTNDTSDSSDKYWSACEEVKDEANSANPTGAYTSRMYEYNHGSHVTGIAAGRNGIAQKAKIVIVQAQSDNIYSCSYSDWLDYGWSSGYPYTCYAAVFMGNDTLRAYNYILEVQSKLPKRSKITALNLSYGGGVYSSKCDSSQSTVKSYFKKMVKAGIIPVAASGNQGYNYSINQPACVSSAYVVGGLSDSKNVRLRNTSNHSKQVDILAPGTNIWSAFLVYESGTDSTCSGINCYGYYSGTSMATPMVTGAFALLKQAYPGRTVATYEKLLKTLKVTTANKRDDGSKVSPRKPVLNFSKIPTYILKAKPGWITGIDHGFELKYPVTKLNNKKITFSFTIVEKSSGKTVIQNAPLDGYKDGKYWYFAGYNKNVIDNGKTYKLKVKQTYPRVSSNTFTITFTPRANSKSTAAVEIEKDAELFIGNQFSELYNPMELYFIGGTTGDTYVPSFMDIE